MKIELSSGIGSGFVGTLTIVFVILKALGYLDWSWWWVFSPLWIMASIIIGGILIFLIVLLILWICHEISNWW